MVGVANNYMGVHPHLLCLQSHGVPQAAQAIDFIFNGNDVQHRVAVSRARVTGVHQFGNFPMANRTFGTEAGDLRLRVEALDALAGNGAIDAGCNVAAKVAIGILYRQLQSIL